MVDSSRLKPDWLLEVQEKQVLHWNYRGITMVPEELKYAGSQLEEIYMKWNYISQLPKWFTAIDHLTNLYLFGNELSSLPEELGCMTSLSVLDVGHNQLTCLPASIVKLRNLRCLSVEFNALTKLPSDIGKLQCLEHLKISGNKLKYLPNSVSLCENLTELVADLNNLKFLPQNIIYLQKLNFFSVKSNQLCFMPAVAFVKKPIEVLIEDNEHLNYLSFNMSSFIVNSRLEMGREEVFDFSNSKEKSSPLASDDSPIVRNAIFLKNLKEELVMPPTINRLYAHSDRCCVISLQELCLRSVYVMLYPFNRLNSKCIQSPINKYLPISIVNSFLDGPSALCHGCKKPIFHEAILIVCSHVMPFISLNLVQKTILTVYFCDRHCFDHFDSSEKNSLLQKQMEWVI